MRRASSPVLQAFTLVEPSEASAQAQPRVGVLDLWGQTRSRSSAFEAMAPEAPTNPVWQVQLPAQAGSAQRLLQSVAVQQAKNEDLLAATLARALRFCANPTSAPAAQPRPASGLQLRRRSRATRPSANSSLGRTPEEAVLSLLAQTQFIAPNTSFEAARSLERFLPASLQEAIADVRAFLAQLSLHVLNFAWVDTRVQSAQSAQSAHSAEGMRIGLTRVTWQGDFETYLQVNTPKDQVDLHLSAVQAALLSRQQLLRQFAVVARTAMAFIGAGLVVGNPLLALAAGYKLIKLVWQELRENAE
ncbi:MAG: hypothetical protein HC853_03425 [Anaerolineae bacterium]|nr:hypothetical protein [Anaerolineae bacterium]